MFQAWQADALVRYTIIRYKLPELIKKKIEAGNAALPQPRFKHGYGGESNPAIPQSCFKHDCTYPIYHQRVVDVENGTLLRHQMHYIIYGQMLVTHL